jgi:trimeric autotransporter adhesin
MKAGRMGRFVTTLAGLAGLAALAASGAGAQTGNITTVAGGGPNNLPQASANLNFPSGVTRDANGNTYVAVQSDHRIYKVSSAGTLTIFAGVVQGYSGDGGPATSANLNNPHSVFLDGTGNVYISDSGNGLIRKIDTSGTITTVAGNFDGNTCPGETDSIGDGCPATLATLADPDGIFVDAAGNIFIADEGNCAVREVTAANGIIQVIAGIADSCGYNGDGQPAASAQLEFPEGVWLDGGGNIYIADTFNNAIREVINGTIFTVAGQPPNAGFSGDGGVATSAQLDGPFAVFVDGNGNIFISDTFNDVVRVVGGPASPGAGIIQTVAGTPENFGFSGDGGPALSAQLGEPEAIFVDGAGNLFLADSNNYRIREVSGGNINTVIGNGFDSFSGDGFAATSGALFEPEGVAVDQSGNLFLADTQNEVIREVSAANQTLSTVAGMFSNTGRECNDPPPSSSPTSVTFCNPTDSFMDQSGNLFIADESDNLVWEVTASNNQIQVIAGITDDESECNETPVGDGCPAIEAFLNGPQSVFVDNSGNLFIADSFHALVREVYCTNPALTCTPPAGFAAGYINTVAGIPGSEPGYNGDNQPATSALLSFPSGVWVDAQGNLFIADQGNAVIREVDTTGTIRTVAGTPGDFDYTGDGGPATSATTSGPTRVAVDAAGNIFFSDCGPDVTDGGPCNAVVREVAAATGNIATVVGNGTQGFSGDGGPATAAQLEFPEGLAFDPAGDVLIADEDNNRIRSAAGLATVIVAAAAPAAVPFGSVPQFTPGSPALVTLTNSGLFPLMFTAAPSVTGPNAGDFAISGGTCAVGTPVARGGSCTVNLTFTPTTGGAESASLTFADNAMPNSQVVPLTGTGIPPSVTITAISPFPAQTVGTTSAPSTTTISVAAGTGTLEFTSITITGTNPGDFAISATGTTCPLSGGMLAGGASCTVAVTFTPAMTGARSAMLSIAGTNLLPSSPQTVALSGTGAAATVSLPANVAFGTVNQGTASAPMTVTLTNTGSTALNFTSAPNVTGTNAADFAITGATCAVGTPVAANGGTCTVTLVFTPATLGAESASLNFADNATPPMQSVPLTGTGGSTSAGFTFTAMPPGSGGIGTVVSILPGDTAVFTLVLQPNPGFIGTIGVACVSTIPFTIATASPASINVTTSPSPAFNVTCTLQTNCVPSWVGPRDNGPQPGPWGTPVGSAAEAMSAIVLLMALLLRRAPQPWAARLAPVLLLVVLLMTVTACVHNDPPVIPNAPTTPAGVYQIQVVATAPGGVKQTVALTVHVI